MGLGSRRTKFSWPHPGWEDFPLFWRAETTNKVRANFLGVSVFKLDRVLTCSHHRFVCDFLSQYHPVLIHPIYSIFEASFISIFLMLHAVVINENTVNDKFLWWEAPPVILFSPRVSFSHNMLPSTQITTWHTFQILNKFFFSPVKSCFPCTTHFTEVQTSWIHCLSSRKSLTKKPDELDIYLWQIHVVLYPSSCMYLCL